MKRAISWILAVCLLLAVLPVGTLAADTMIAEGSCGEDLQWTFYDSGLLRITGSGRMDYYNNTPEVPWFDYLAEISAVSFPEGLENLSHFTFYRCTKLTAVTFPQTLQELGNSAFDGCTGLTAVVIPDSVTQLGAGTFAGCENLQLVELSDSLTGIHSNVFKSCTKLSVIEIPEGVTWIGEDAFENCRSLKSLKLPHTLKSIGAGAFTGCVAIEDLDIPAGVETIGNDAFYGCSGYETLRIPEGACVGLRAFVGGQFTEFYLPDNVHCLGNFAFEACDGITAVTIPSSQSSISNGLFYHCESLQNVTIPETITDIRSHAFSGCKMLKYLVIPGSVKVIADYSLGYLENAEIRFLGDAPKFESYVFNRSVATCYYPAENDTWTEAVRQQYGGTVTWVPVSGCAEIHTWTTTIFAPTCTEEGYTLRVCQLCGAREEQNPVDALGHRWSEWVTTREPACLVDGSRYRSCDRCGERETESIPATGHTMGEWSVEREPTCTVDGAESRSCGNCGFTERRAVAAPGHQMGEWYILREPDCRSTGTRKRECQACDHFEVEQLPRVDHDYVTEVIAPTCTASGYTIGNCTICGTTERYDETEPLGHAYEGGKCGRCGEILDSGFSDVAVGSFYFDAVRWAVERDITKGTAEGVFSPETTCNRAQAVTFLWRAEGCPEPVSCENPFSDVQETSFYYTAVLWAVENGITNGIGNGMFGTEDICTREQIVTFLWRAADSPEQAGESGFRDVAKDQWYAQSVLWAVENGITNGVADGIFGIGQFCNRAQMVTFLHRSYSGT